jgi:hypothetical protein
MDYKEILKALPGNWNELTLRTYIKLSPVLNDSDKEEELYNEDIFTEKLEADVDKNIQILGLLTDVPVEVLLTGYTMNQFEQFVTKLMFMSTAPVTVKPTVKYISFEKLTYDGFISFDRLHKDFSDGGILGSSVSNLPMMLSIFSKDKLTPEQIEDLSIPEVIAGFFTVAKNLEKYLRRSERSLYKQLMKIYLKTAKALVMQLLMKYNPFKKISHKGGTIG